jgi:hypothetical protein
MGLTAGCHKVVSRYFPDSKAALFLQKCRLKQKTRLMRKQGERERERKREREKEKEREKEGTEHKMSKLREGAGERPTTVPYTVVPMFVNFARFAER